MSNPVGWSSIYPPQYMSNQDPNVSPVASRALMSDVQKLGLLGRRGPVTGADLPVVEARGQGLMDNAMTVAGAVNPVGGPPLAPWATVKHGEPSTVLGWRGGSGGNGLSDEWQKKLGRRFLLDDGYYVAPTKQVAAKWGEPTQNRVQFQKPYVMDRASPNDVARLDLDALRAQGYDGLIIKDGTSGSALGNERMAQAVAWPPTKGRVVENAGRLKGEFEVGAMLDLHPTAKLVQQAVGDVKQAKVVGFSPWGHPEIKIGGKRVSLNPSDYTVNPNYLIPGMVGGGAAGVGLLSQEPAR